MGLFEALSETRSSRPTLNKLPLPCTLRQIWTALDFVTVSPELIHAIINANYFVSPPAFRKACGWTECAFSPTTRREREEIQELETATTRYLFEGGNPRGMVLTVQRARANALFRGELTVRADDVRRAAPRRQPCCSG